jgi:threonine dehydrogenase-like Zn-dependent dehydrogenase
MTVDEQAGQQGVEDADRGHLGGRGHALDDGGAEDDRQRRQGDQQQLADLRTVSAGDAGHVFGAGLVPHATVAINTSREPLPEALARRGVEGGPTLIYDAVCHPSILEEAVRIAAPAGRIGVLGFSTTPSAIPQQELTKKELTLYASRLNCAMFPTVIDWIARGLVDPGHIITHQVDFRDVAGAFAITERNPRESCKVLLDFGADA